MAVRERSLLAAAKRLGITPAAVGQRIRALEDVLGTDLLLRGRSGLTPTAELSAVLGDRKQAFDSLERVGHMLDFQRVSEIHIVADPDWADLWLLPRLPDFRGEHPNIRFCINGTGDVPVRLGSPDLRIDLGDGPGQPLFRDVIVPVTGPDNTRRMIARDSAGQMEGMPLLHLSRQTEGQAHPGWVDWFQTFGHRKTGNDRGVRYQNAHLALEAVRQNVGFLVCGLSFVLRELDAGRVVLPFPMSEHLLARHPYQLRLRPNVVHRRQTQTFVTWLEDQAKKTQAELDALVAQRT